LRLSKTLSGTQVATPLSLDLFNMAVVMQVP
jgi:hypothetical protein